MKPILSHTSQCRYSLVVILMLTLAVTLKSQNNGSNQLSIGATYNVPYFFVSDLFNDSYKGMINNGVGGEIIYLMDSVKMVGNNSMELSLGYFTLPFKDEELAKILSAKSNLLSATVTSKWTSIPFSIGLSTLTSENKAQFFGSVLANVSFVSFSQDVVSSNETSGSNTSTSSSSRIDVGFRLKGGLQIPITSNISVSAHVGGYVPVYLVYFYNSYEIKNGVSVPLNYFIDDFYLMGEAGARLSFRF